MDFIRSSKKPAIKKESGHHLRGGEAMAVANHRSGKIAGHERLNHHSDYGDVLAEIALRYPLDYSNVVSRGIQPRQS